MSRVLVTGGAGFIGSTLADFLLALEHEVAIVDDLSTGFRSNVPAAARFYTLDIRSERLPAVMSEFRPEIVFHLAGQMDVRISLQRPLHDSDINVRGTINVLEAAVHSGTRKLVFASTGGAIYGEPESLPATEGIRPRPKSHYAVSKLCGEEYIKLYGRLYDLDFTILRFPNVYGPRQNPHGESGVCSIFIDLMARGKTPKLFGFGTPLRDYVYVDDVVRGTIAALDRGSGETINLGSEVGTSVRDVFDVVRPLTGFEGSPELLPLRPGEVQDIYTSGEKARRILGWSPEVTLEVGLARTYEWWSATRRETA